MSRHSMACLSWSPSSLPGGVIGAREQPRRGPNNEEPTVDPAPAAIFDLEVSRCSVDGIGAQHSTGDRVARDIACLVVGLLSNRRPDRYCRAVLAPE